MKTIWTLSIAAFFVSVLFFSSRGAAETDSIDVTAFGAKPDDAADDTLAVLAAFEKCRTDKAHAVVFPKGRYEFHEGANPASPRMSVPLNDLHDVEIDGQGSEFIFHGITSCFGFSNCSNISVKNMLVDWDRPPFSVGVVTVSDADSFEVEVFPEFPVQGGEPVQAYMDYEADTQMPCRQSLDVYCLENPVKTELIRPQVLRIRAPHKTAPVVPGRWIVLRHQVYAYNGFAAHNCKDMKFRDITLYTCPGMGFIGITLENIALERCQVRPKPGTRRVISATADGSHFGGCTGDLVIRDCLFDGQGDDAINMKSGLFLNIEEIVDERTVLARHNLGMVCLPLPGDEMELMPQETLLAYGSVRVKAASLEPDAPGGKKGLHRVALENALPPQAKPGHMLANATRLPRALISNCTFQRNRARGMLIQIRDAVVENCTFKDVTSAGVLIITETVHFYESIPARNVTIRNNTFEHCNYGAGIARGVVSIEGITPGWKDAPLPGVFHDIIIEGNKIQGADNSGIFVTGSDTVTVRDNTIRGVCAKPTHAACAAAIHIESSRNVTLEGNAAELSAQGEGCKQTLGLADNNERDTFRISGNAGF